MAQEAALLSATRATKELLTGMLRKKWIAREDLSGEKIATRTRRVAILKSVEGKLNQNQRTLVETLAAAGGRAPVEQLGTLEVPRTTLRTLVRRGIVELAEEALEFHMSGMKARPSPFDFQFTPGQQNALAQIRGAVDSRNYKSFLLHGVTGSGKTAVYLAAMHAVLQQGRSAILLVPEIGLTPAVAADLHQIFGDEVAILHSALTGPERGEQWNSIKRGEARIVVGTRSAVFAPVSDLRSEEHTSE